MNPNAARRVPIRMGGGGLLDGESFVSDPRPVHQSPELRSGQRGSRSQRAERCVCRPCLQPSRKPCVPSVPPTLPKGVCAVRASNPPVPSHFTCNDRSLLLLPLPVVSLTPVLECDTRIPHRRPQGPSPSPRDLIPGASRCRTAPLPFLGPLRPWTTALAKGRQVRPRSATGPLTSCPLLERP